MDNFNINEKKYEKILDLTSDLLCITHMDGQFRYVNPAFEKVLGYDSEELVGLTLYAIIHPEDIIVANNTLQRLLEEKNDRSSFELQHRCKDGTYKWINWNTRIDWTENLVYSAGQDVTEKKQTVDALDEIADRYKQIFNKHDSAFVCYKAIYDENKKPVDYKVLDVNPAYERITGLKRTDVVGKLATEIEPDIKTLRPDVIELIGNVASSQIPIHIEEKLIRTKWFDLTLFSPRKGYTVANFSDISVRKTAEDELRKTKKRLLEAQGFAHLGYWELDGVTGEHPWSDELFRICGFKPQEFIPTFNDFINIIHPADKEFVIKHIKENLNSHEYKFDLRVCRPDNEIVWAHVKVRHEYNASGSLVRTYGIVQDVTERKRSEVKLEESEEKFKELVENLGEMIWIQQDGQIIYINPAYEKVTGRTCQSLYDSPLSFLDWIHPDDKERVVQAYLFEYTSPGSFDEQYRIIRPDDSIRWIWSRTFPIYDENRKKVRCVGIGDDISKIKEYEESLRLARGEAETANKAKSQFLANMSHEIRTPMNGVLGMAQLLVMNLKGENKELASIIKSSGDDLLKIIDDILDLSRIEAGKVRLSREEFDINSLVNDVNIIMEPSAKQKGISYKSYVDRTIVNNLTGDPDRLKQVLFNLLGNAIKFTEQGRIELSIAKGKVFEDKVQLIFSVNDSGIGIAGDKVGHLFTYFTQGDDSVTKKYGGTGLGLAISKQLINMMGGEISVESQLGVGSDFVFSALFKLKDNKKDAINSRTEDISSVVVVSSSSTALLVEDDYVSGMVIKILCERKGINLKIATNGNQAIEILKAESFDLIFMDIQMPDISGYETTEIIRDMERKLNKHTPIIATTAFTLVGDREKCIEAGMDDYLAKPIDAEKFYALVERWQR